MKVWIKLLLGVSIGVALGVALPFYGNAFLLRLIDFLPELALRIGSYIAPPLVFFSLAVSIYDLRSQGSFWGIIGKLLLIIVVISSITITFGILVCALFFKTERIPIIIESISTIDSLSVKSAILEIFPSNMFAPLAGNGMYLFPIFVAAFFLGMGLVFDKNVAKPVLQVLDSLSKTFSHIAAFFSEILWFVMIILAAFFTYNYRNMLSLGIYSNFITLILGVTLFFCFVILPFILYLLRGKRQFQPLHKLYGSLGTAIAAFFSGSINFTVPIIFHHNRENLGIGNKLNSVSTTMFLSIGRAGSAMIAAVSFIVVLQSYSSLQITPKEYLDIALRALLVSVLLGRNGHNGAFAALWAICLWSREGFETGCLILKPVAFLLVACGALIDCMIAAMGSYYLASLTRNASEEKNIRHFV